MRDVQIDESHFERRYKPIPTETGGWRDFSWSESADMAMVRAAHAENRVWTTVEGDDGVVLLASGV